MARCRKSACFVFLVTLTILMVFFYYIMLANWKSVSTVSRLQSDVQCLTMSLLHQQKGAKPDGQPINAFGCLSGDTQGSMGASALTGCDTREMASYLDSLFKRKFGTVMDDVYHLKKQVMSFRCDSPQPIKQSETLALPTSRINYASEDLGARINHITAKPLGGSNIFKSILGLDFKANPPVNMLRSSITPGSCFGFLGSNATISIRLAKVIIVEEIALTHIPKESTPTFTTDNAPKEFEVYGFKPDKEKEMLGQWTYDNAPKKRTQTYKVNNNNPLRSLVFVVSSNHGANTTCVYRLEVFGRVL
ncbi:SUN domain-containing protein 2 [Drosophila nasuta]|uniref:SUN domain-containing protein 2 n=1 Tax=Drosophila nasuta TaxID=42062 RepID=UPI00295F15BF|nr:SUN domain-containing protein 2 [Drosophila nasuta]